MSDQSRLKRCREGDKKAFREFYDLYAKAMLNISARIVNSVEEAEDVLQESFLAAFGQVEKIRSDAEFGGYLKKIVINRSIDIVRKKKVGFETLKEKHDVEEENNEEQLTYDLTLLRQCIAELPAGFRVVLTLFLFENYSHKEIAATLNISEGTSKSQYNRARKKLAELYKQKQLIHA